MGRQSDARQGAVFVAATRDRGRTRGSPRSFWKARWKPKAKPPPVRGPNGVLRAPRPKVRPATARSGEKRAWRPKSQSQTKDVLRSVSDSSRGVQKVEGSKPRPRDKNGVRVVNTETSSKNTRMEEGEVDSIQADHPKTPGRHAGKEEGRGMISHVVLFRPKAARSAADRKTLVDALQKRRHRHSRNQTRAIAQAGSGSIALAMKHKWPSTMSTRPSSTSKRTDLRAYLDHPAHVALGNCCSRQQMQYWRTHFAAVDPGTLGT